MILPSIKINLSSVAEAIGNKTNDLGTLITKASIGGTAITINGQTFPVAFNVKESGATVYDGTLKDGAEPYWNIFSTAQPGKWWMHLDVSDFTKSYLYHRLLRDKDLKYCFALHGFANHNTAAKAPSMSDDEVQIDQGNADVLVQFTIQFNFGNYDWRIVDSNHQYYMLIATKKDFPEVIIGQTEPTLLGEPNGITKQMVVKVTTSNNPDFYGTTKPLIGYVNSYLCDSSGNYLVKMPNMQGELKMIISQTSTIVGQIFAYIDGQYEFLITNKLTGGKIDKVTNPHDVITFSAKKLRDLESKKDYVLDKIVITKRRKSDGIILYTYTKTTINPSFYDTPKNFSSNLGGQTDLAYSFSCDLLNTAFTLAATGEEAVVAFYYKY